MARPKAIDLLRANETDGEEIEARLGPDVPERVFPRAFAAGGCNVKFDLSHVENIVES